MTDTKINSDIASKLVSERLININFHAFRTLLWIAVYMITCRVDMSCGHVFCSSSIQLRRVLPLNMYNVPTVADEVDTRNHVVIW